MRIQGNPGLWRRLAERFRKGNMAYTDTDDGVRATDISLLRSPPPRRLLVGEAQTPPLRALLADWKHPADGSGDGEWEHSFPLPTLAFTRETAIVVIDEVVSKLGDVFRERSSQYMGNVFYAADTLDSRRNMSLLHEIALSRWMRIELTGCDAKCVLPMVRASKYDAVPEAVARANEVLSCVGFTASSFARKLYQLDASSYVSKTLANEPTRPARNAASSAGAAGLTMRNVTNTGDITVFRTGQPYPSCNDPSFAPPLWSAPALSPATEQDRFRVNEDDAKLLHDYIRKAWFITHPRGPFSVVALRAVASVNTAALQLWTSATCPNALIAEIIDVAEKDAGSFGIDTRYIVSIHCGTTVENVRRVNAPSCDERCILRVKSPF